MTAEINTPLTHIEKALDFSKASGLDNELPSTLLDTIQTIVEAKGWQAVELQSSFDETSAVNVQSLRSPSPASGERWWVFAAHAFHTDAGANHTLRLDFEDLGTALTVGVTTAVSVAAFQAIALPRPILLRPSQAVRVSSIDLVGLGNTLGLQGFFVNLQEGEYVPGGSPFG